MKHKTSGLLLLLLLGLSCTRETSPPAAPPRIGKVPVLERWIQKDLDKAVEQGASQPVLIDHQAGVPGDRLGDYVEIDSGQCVAFLARGSSSIDDIDVLVYATNGEIQASDQDEAKAATAILCPPHPELLYVTARITAGHGLVTLAAIQFAPALAPPIARALGAERQLKKAQPLDSAWPGLDDALVDHYRAIGGSWETVRKVAVHVDSRTPSYFSLRLRARRCLDLLVVPSDEVSQLQVELLDLDGRVLGRARPWEELRAIVL